MFVFPELLRRLPRSRRLATEIRISYDDGRRLLRTLRTQVKGTPPVSHLIARLSTTEGVREVGTIDGEIELD